MLKPRTHSGTGGEADWTVRESALEDDEREEWA